MILLDFAILRLLYRRGLSRRLPAFTVYLWITALGACSLAVLKATPFYFTNVFGVWYWTTSVAMSVSSLYTAYSFWRVGLAKYRGFHRLCVGLVVAMMVVVTIAMAYLINHSVAIGLGANQWLNQWFALMIRSFNFMCAALLLLFFGLLAVFRIELSRTVRDFAMVLFLFSMGRAIVRSLEALYPYTVLSLTIANMVVSLLMAAGFIWIAARHQVDEAVETAPVFALSSNRADLEMRMQTMNQALIRILG